MFCIIIITPVINMAYQVRVGPTVDGHKLLRLALVNPHHAGADNEEAPLSKAVDDVYVALAMSLHAEQLQRRGQQDAVCLAQCTVGMQGQVGCAGANA